MSIPRSLFKLDDVRDDLELRTENQNAIAQTIIYAVTAQVEAYCNTTFDEYSGVLTYSGELHDGDGTATLFLDHGPLVAVSELIITSGGVDDTIPPTDYVAELFKAKITLTEGDKFLSGVQNVSVTYTAGHALVPEIVKFAGMRLVQLYLRKWSDNRSGVQSISDGVRTITYTDQIPRDIKEMLNQYRRIAVG